MPGAANTRRGQPQVFVSSIAVAVSTYDANERLDAVSFDRMEAEATRPDADAWESADPRDDSNSDVATEAWDADDEANDESADSDCSAVDFDNESDDEAFDVEGASRYADSLNGHDSDSDGSDSDDSDDDNSDDDSDDSDDEAISPAFQNVIHFSPRGRLVDHSYAEMNDDDDDDDLSDRFDREVKRPKKVYPQVPIQKFIIWKDENGDDKLDEVWYRKLRDAAIMAQKWIVLAVKRIDDIYDGSGTTWIGRRNRWLDDTYISRWFGKGSLTNRQIRLVRRRLRKLAEWFRNGLRIHVIKARRGIRRGACWGQAAYMLRPRIYLCPKFFGEDRRTADNATTLIHELTHRLAQRSAKSGRPKVYFGHPWVSFAKPVKSNFNHIQRAKDLATRRPIRARRSPVNFALLCREIGLRVDL